MQTQEFLQKVMQICLAILLSSYIAYNCIIEFNIYNVPSRHTKTAAMKEMLKPDNVPIIAEHY